MAVVQIASKATLTSIMAISNSGILGLKYFAGVSLKDKTPGLDDDDDDELLVVNVCALFTWDTPGWTLGYETGCCTVFD